MSPDTLTAPVALPGLLAACATRPEWYDADRLVLADWLDEHDDPRAGKVRKLTRTALLVPERDGGRALAPTCWGAITLASDHDCYVRVESLNGDDWRPFWPHEPGGWLRLEDYDGRLNYRLGTFSRLRVWWRPTATPGRLDLTFRRPRQVVGVRGGPPHISLAAGSRAELLALFPELRVAVPCWRCHRGEIRVLPTQWPDRDSTTFTRLVCSTCGGAGEAYLPGASHLVPPDYRASPTP